MVYRLGVVMLMVGCVINLVFAELAWAQYGSGYGSMTETGEMMDTLAAYDDLLARYVSDPDSQGLTHFNYGALKDSPEDMKVLETYIVALEVKHPESFTVPEAVVFWANLYNALTLRVVTQNYPVRSIRNIRSGFRPGPWKRKLTIVGGKPLSLDDIEHGILREKFPSPMIHYMINCASIGCPNLLNRVWRAERLEADQIQAARAYINSPRGVKITPSGLELSSIYKWFAEDFGRDDASILAHVRTYAAPELERQIDQGAVISGYDYNWALND